MGKNLQRDAKGAKMDTEDTNKCDDCTEHFSDSHLSPAECTHCDSEIRVCEMCEEHENLCTGCDW